VPEEVQLASIYTSRKYGMNFHLQG